jgi:hypothetical protein
LEGLSEHNGATASVWVAWPEEDRGQAQRFATDAVRDAVGVLRLYKRARYPVLNLDVQDFGLVGGMGNALEWRAVTQGRRLVGSQAHLVGVVGDWTFRPEDVRDFHLDVRFAFLDRALRMGSPTEIERRVLTCLRLLGLASSMLTPQLQVVLLATALEALLWTKPATGEPQGKSLPIAQLTAYLICGQSDMPYPGRPPCFYLTSKSENAMKLEIAARRSAGEDPRCTDFGHVFQLFQDRNAALHVAREQFGTLAIGWYWRSVDAVILSMVDWISRRKATALNELQSEFQEFLYTKRLT